VHVEEIVEVRDSEMYGGLYDIDLVRQRRMDCTLKEQNLVQPSEQWSDKQGLEVTHHKKKQGGHYWNEGGHRRGIPRGEVVEDEDFDVGVRTKDLYKYVF